ncbi:preprotein translocase subunit YajC [Desulfitobacterium chlororespirans]|uniref:Protein translocase subunit yajC n=1 Tax=Desulfitobacterium chlororespirans DSM 11544 TaxID=1121395 RepID=A0A1M7U792_9FIRM|nr:preprotein translocase subunit YajC [Desulfitobacterium chlororespirans]SHN78932.1 protein translocase subunit yajC [Desulfitobacterium chlororespirans DSM 11544]
MDQGTMTLLIYVVVFGGIMYFFMIRPQQKQAKQRRAMLDSLRVNDKIITAGGIYGKIRKVKDDSVIIQVADKVEIEVTKNGIGSVENREIVVEKEKKAEKKDKAEKNEEVVEQEQTAE